MSSFERVAKGNSASLVAGSTHEEEQAYWESNDKGPQQQRYDTPLTTSPEKYNEQGGFLSKLSGSEIGSACENLAKNIGNQAKNLGDQAKTFGEQAKGCTMANTSSAAAAMNRFKNQLVAAVDGVPLRHDGDQLQESGTTSSAGREKGGGEYEDEQGKGRERDRSGQRPCSTAEEGNGEEEATAVSSAAAAPKKAAGATHAKGNQVDGGMVDESGPVLGLGAWAAALKKKPTGGATSTQQVQARNGVALGSSDTAATTPPDSSAKPSSGAGGGNQGGEGRSGGDGDDTGALKIIPRTASLVGGRQWTVLASLYDTTASVVDETIGDLFT